MLARSGSGVPHRRTVYESGGDIHRNLKEKLPRTAHPLLCNVNFSRIPRHLLLTFFSEWENNKQTRRFGRRPEGLGGIDPSHYLYFIF